ncbi:MAG: cytochrome C oxidase subunit IV family protein [Verrucomicrobia subdivision 3 bacterium]|nr:cytochrome C oxidase subunit IV family protein [Limisphaerales bacterium]
MSNAHTQAQPHPHTHSAAAVQAHAHDVAKHVKVYIAVFLGLLAGTVATVAMYYVHLDSVPLTITIALFIATVKAFLVAGFFMHLISEKKTIYAILLATAFFFAGMMYLIVWGRDEVPRGTQYWEGRNVQLPVDKTR